MFRRRSASTVDAPEPSAEGAPESRADAGAASRAMTAGKGRPTPKRSEAERRRRQPYAAPGDRKQAARQVRERQAVDRRRRSEAMQRGEEWALPVRDRGPVKALARDYVDSRRRISEFYMYGLLVLMALLFVRNAAVMAIVQLLIIVAIVVMLIETLFIGYRVRALAAQRYPGESTRGIRMYAGMRALQIRQLRMPKPRIKPGGSY